MRGAVQDSGCGVVQNSAFKKTGSYDVPIKPACNNALISIDSAQNESMISLPNRNVYSESLQAPLPFDLSYSQDLSCFCRKFNDDLEIIKKQGVENTPKEELHQLFNEFKIIFKEIRPLLVKLRQDRQLRNAEKFNDFKAHAQERKDALRKNLPGSASAAVQDNIQSGSKLKEFGGVFKNAIKNMQTYRKNNQEIRNEKREEAKGQRKTNKANAKIEKSEAKLAKDGINADAKGKNLENEINVLRGNSNNLISTPVDLNQAQNQAGNELLSFDPADLECEDYIVSNESSQSNSTIAEVIECMPPSQSKLTAKSSMLID